MGMAFLLGLSLKASTGARSHVPERRVVPVIAGRYPLSEAAKALRFFGSGQATGKVVVTVEQGASG